MKLTHRPNKKPCFRNSRYPSSVSNKLSQVRHRPFLNYNSADRECYETKNVWKYLSHFEKEYTTALIPMSWFFQATIYASLLGKMYYLDLILKCR